MLLKQFLAYTTLGLSAMTAQVFATPIAVSPVIVRLKPGSDFSFVDVSNRSNSAVSVQVEIVKVQWKDGQETYQASGDFLLSPPSFRLPEAKSRIIRFKYDAKHGETEGFYRLFVRQLPEELPTAQINMLLTIGVPIFIQPTRVLRTLAVNQVPNLENQYELQNTGNITLTIKQLSGNACTQGSIKIAARLAPEHKIKLPENFSKCINNADTDQGTIDLQFNANFLK